MQIQTDIDKTADYVDPEARLSHQSEKIKELEYKVRRLELSMKKLKPLLDIHDRLESFVQELKY